MRTAAPRRGSRSTSVHAPVAARDAARCTATEVTPEPGQGDHTPIGPLRTSARSWIASSVAAGRVGSNPTTSRPGPDTSPRSTTTSARGGNSSWIVTSHDDGAESKVSAASCLRARSRPTMAISRRRIPQGDFAHDHKGVARATANPQDSGMEAAFFDLDKTIIARSSPLALGRSFYKEGLISRSFMLKSLYAQMMFQLMGASEDKMERMRVAAAKLTVGWDPERVREVVNQVIDEVITPLIYAEAIELIHEHRSNGRIVCIVSSSPEEIVEPFARMLDIDRWIATRPQIVDGKYTGELDFYAYGSHKADAIKEMAARDGLRLEGSFAYTDSITDVPMLEAVGRPVAINPDKELERLALDRGWDIQHFRDPIPLRSRLPQLRTPELSGKERASVVGVMALILFAWWFSRRTPRDRHA
jgi:HAD superfamily hydrolase (TIGR01490 family)